MAISARGQDQAADAISREVKDLFDRCAKAVVKIHGVDEHSELSGTGFFIDPTGTIYTAYSVGGEGANFTVEFGGKKMRARQLVADLRSGIAMLKVDADSPALPIGRAEQLGVAAPVVMIGYPLDLPETPSFGMVAGFDRKYLDQYLTTTHLRVNLPAQRGEAGAPLLNMKGEVVGIVVSSLENSSSCYALPIEAAEKIRGDYMRFGEVRHGWIGAHLAEAPEQKDGSRAELTDIIEDTPAADAGLKSGDILLQVGTKQIHQPDDIIDASFFLTAGDVVPITVLRDGQKVTVNVEAAVHPAAQNHAIAAPGTNQAFPLRLEQPTDNTP
ncbi:MAG: serine protease [Verrucomicrobia bacterium]|nr:serine protease [Verrucomicrobiota bacterium]